jgi:hypothetical protein
LRNQRVILKRISTMILAAVSQTRTYLWTAHSFV